MEVVGCPEHLHMLGKHLQNNTLVLVETSLVDMVLRWIKIMPPMEI
jgi:hypothetical protein